MGRPVPPRDGVDRRTVLRTAAGAATASLLAGGGIAPAATPAAAGSDAAQPVDLSGTSARWGNAAVTPQADAVDFTGGAMGLLPKVARLPVSFPAAGAGWALAIAVESRLVPGDRRCRRDIEDFALSFADGRVQLWLGGPRTAGLRLTVYGRAVAAAAVHAAPAGTVNTLRIEVAADGSVAASANGAVLATVPGAFADPGLAPGGPIDLVSRVGPARWSAATASGLVRAAHAGAPWRRRPGEPVWDARERIGFGYQPQPTHLWNRWTGELLRTPADYSGLPALGGGTLAITHGPLLGLPAAGRLGVLARTAAPARARLVGGPGDDPADWRTLAVFDTAAEAGNTGHAEIDEGAFATGVEALRCSLALDDRVADLRDDAGAWPLLRRRWLTLAARDTATLAVTHCDNFYPAAAPLLSQAWRSRAADADLLLHLGDVVYEQGFRRRASVSRLDHLDHFAPGSAQAWRGRLLPTVALFDDHDLYNDVTGTGATGPFATSAPAGTHLPPDMPWRIASRDTGRAVWEEWAGWGTPRDSRQVLLAGTGTVDAGVLIPDDFAPWRALAEADIAALAPLIVRPDSVPEEPWDIRPACAGGYRVVGVDAAGGIVRLDPAPHGRAAVAWSVSSPRYGSLRIGNAELLLLDTRTERTFWQVDRADPRASMLGATQRAWLLDRIRAATADVLFLASSNTLSFANEAGEGALAKRDSWTGYTHERDLILAALAARGGPAVLLTGDLHTTAVRRLSPQIHEVICGAWSNIGFPGLVDAMRPVAGFGDAELLWAGPGAGPDAEWASWSTFFETDRDGRVALEVIDLAADRTVAALRL